MVITLAIPIIGIGEELDENQASSKKWRPGYYTNKFVLKGNSVNHYCDIILIYV